MPVRVRRTGGMVQAQVRVVYGGVLPCRMCQEVPSRGATDCIL